jgi:hypothetical protein
MGSDLWRGIFSDDWEGGSYRDMMVVGIDRKEGEGRKMSMRCGDRCLMMGMEKGVKGGAFQI